ncbi:glutathione S-transferase [Elysia marginata]|uniref:Glutathione S-transferase n=1 Tax=Elysia marginata TaxID=1093978 RepID=A0AAV4JKF7_9GAST|nr:glutathione S-transferase [Elysia marginata]
MAITSYLAREAGLYGTSNIEALKIDQIVQTREDLLTEEVKVWKEKDAAKNAEMTKNMDENVYPKILGKFEKLIKENQNKTGSKFSVGNQLTLADIILLEGTVTVSQKNPALLDKYPAVKGVASLAADLDGIKQYLAKRAKTDL